MVDSNMTPGEIWWLNNLPWIGKPPIFWRVVIGNNMSSVLWLLSLRKLVVIPIVMSFRQLTRGLVGVVWMALCWCKVVTSQRNNRSWGRSYRWFPNIKRRKSLNVSRIRWRITNFYQYTKVCVCMCVSGRSSWESVQRSVTFTAFPISDPFTQFSFAGFGFNPRRNVPRLWFCSLLCLNSINNWREKSPES